MTTDRTDRARAGQLTGDAAELYQEWFVPALFDQWPERLVELAGVETGEAVLDVGCGTGVLTLACASRVGPQGSVTGLDPNPGMLAVARRLAAGVAWQQGYAEELPWPEATFDRVLSQFVLMFVADAAAAVSELRRVTRPGGRVVVATWAEVDRSPGYAAMVELIGSEVGSAAAEALLAPFCMGTPDALGALLRPAFPDVAVSRLEGRARFPSLDAWLDTDVRAWTLADLVTDDEMQRLRDAAPAALSAWVGASGTVEFPAPALVAVATR